MCVCVCVCVCVILNNLKFGSKWKKIPNLGLLYHATTNFNSKGNYLKHLYLFEFVKQSIPKKIEANTTKQEKNLM